MDEQKKLLIQKAQDKHKKIYPCGRWRSFHECFTMHEGRLLFWYNTECGTTHILKGDDVTEATHA